nr:MAG TPA: hypothetical protein [Caudoviricetes sp.]
MGKTGFKFRAAYRSGQISSGFTPIAAAIILSPLR